MEMNTIRIQPRDNRHDSRHARLLVCVRHRRFKSWVFGDPCGWRNRIRAATRYQSVWICRGDVALPHGFEAQGNVLFDLVNAQNVNGLVVAGILGHYIGVKNCKHSVSGIRISQWSALRSLCRDPQRVVDFYHGMREILVHLIEVHDYRRIAFIRSPEESLTGEERYRAYTEVLTEHGMHSI